MASDNDITVRKRRCKDVFDGDLAHYIPGSSDDALTYSNKAELWAVKWPDAEDDGKVDYLDYSSKKWAVYTDGPVDTTNNLFSSKLYALNAEEQAGISLSWANKSQEWAESDTVIEGTEISYSSKHWSSVSKLWSDDALSYSLSASNAQQMAWKWALKTDGPVTGDLYSAKYWADKAEERSGGSEQWSIISHNWANGGLAEGATQPSSTDTNSSLYWAYQSALSAAAANQYQQLAYSYQEESKRLKLDAVIARTGAETALVKAETALRLAETAQTAAETALTAAETAQGKAEDALEAAETALAAAEAALDAAETAQTKSEQAQDAAETALTAAETAQGKAETAKNAAEAALTAAEVAQGKAEDAQTAAETAQGKSEEALTAAETALTAAETALDITEAARDRAQEWAESDQAITVPGDTDTHYSAKKHAQDALDTFGLTANVYTLTVGVYNDTTIASAAAHGHADDAMRANESAQEAKGDAIDAQTAAETALAAAEAARDLAQEWADNDEDVPVGATDDKYSAKHWSIKAENAVASLGNVAMRDAANVFQSDNQFNGNVSIGLPGTPGDKAKCQLNRTSGSYNASGALIDNLGRYMLITNNGAGNKTNFITYINNHSSDLDITASSADGNYIYLEAKVAGTYTNEIEYYAVGSFYNNSQGSTTLGTTTTGTDEVKAQCKTANLTSNLGLAGAIVYTKSGVVKGIAVAPVLSGSRTLLELANLINENEDLDFTAEVSGSALLLTNKEFGADSTVYYRTGCFAALTHLKVKQGTVTPGTEDIPSSSNTLTLNGESVPTHFGNNEYVGINIFTGPVGIQSTGSFTNNGMTVLNQGAVINGATVINGDTSITGAVTLDGSLIVNGVAVDNIQGSKFFNCTKATEILEIDPLIKYRRHVTLHIKGPMVNGNNGEALGSQLFGEQPGWLDRIVDITIDKDSNYWSLTGFRAGTLNLHIKDGYNGGYLTVSAKVKNFIVQLDTCTNFGALTKQMSGVEHIAVLAPKATRVFLDWLNGYTTNTLTSIVLITPEAVNCENMLTYEVTQNSLVTYFYMPYTSKVENANYAFSNGSNGTSSAKSIPSSQFPGSWPSLKTGVHMFSYCALLDATKANTILDSLPDWSDEETPTTHEIGFTGTKAATEWAAEGADLSHIEAAEAKGWTVVGRPAITE